MEPPAPTTPGAHAHEPISAQFQGIGMFAVILAGFTALVMLGLALVMRHYHDRERRIESARPALYRDDRGQFPSPRLQGDPAADLARMRRENQDALGRYGWVDQAAGVARLPIDRAIDLIAEKGLPTK